jgi:hypothetical protein
MKKPIYFLGAIMIIVALLFTSCQTVQVAKFASVENLYQIKLNSSLEEVVSLLGSKPYNILSNQVDGYTIFTYRYKLVERMANPNYINSKGFESSGNEVYNGKEHTLYLFFKANKLESFITTEGRRDSPAMILLNNTLYKITVDKIVALPSEDVKYKVIQGTLDVQGTVEESKPNTDNVPKKSVINVFSGKKTK